MTISDADRATLLRFVDHTNRPEIGKLVKRLLDGTADEPDRQRLAGFAWWYDDEYPLTCEALVRVLDGRTP